MLTEVRKMSRIDTKKLVNPPKEYRPVPFWSWNEKLDTKETAWQVHEMDRVGLGGYFMHARGGLQTEYMSDEWFDNVKTTLKEGKATGMKNWGYDENGWPSGFASGKINGMGEKYQQKYLRCELTDAPVNTDRTIGNFEYDGKNAHIYYDVNEFYVDLMDPEVTKEFIKRTHEVYKKELGDDFKDMEGFFTDEPQLSRDGLPWSLILLDEYKKKYGEDLKPKLLEIFYRIGDYAVTRYRYWELVRDLFADNYLGQLYKWCQENGTKLTGHMVLEEGINIQITANSAVMANYEFFDYPGFDCLCRILIETMGPTQVASVAHQLGKKHVLSETFALSGHNVNFEDLRHIYEYQMVRGATLLCEHLFGYSLRGIRKRDYPPALFYHQPWWNESHNFSDFVSRIGMLLSDGKVKFDVLVMHPQSSAWIAYDEPKNRNMFNFPVINSTELLKIDRDFASLLVDIEKEQIPYHLGDERIINRYGKVENGKFIVGNQAYSIVVIPSCTTLNSYVFELLEQFKAQGGTIVFSDEMPYMINGEKTDKIKNLAQGYTVVPLGELAKAIPTDISKVKMTPKNCDFTDVYSTIRHFDDDAMAMQYIVNSSIEDKEFEFDFGDKCVNMFDTKSGMQYAIELQNGKYTCKIEGRDSIVFFVYDKKVDAPSLKSVECNCDISDKLRGNWDLVKSGDNLLVLDYCDCYFDGELVEKDVYILDIQEKACDLMRPVRVDLDFKFNVEAANTESFKLLVETPEKFDISINGESVSNKSKGYMFDKAFEIIDLEGKARQGQNVVRLSMNFTQSEEVYKDYPKCTRFEGVRNKFSYDNELECIYLAGDFGVNVCGELKEGEKQDTFFDGKEFTVVDSKSEVETGDLTSQGLPFFAGNITLKKKVNLSKDELRGAYFKLEKLASVIAGVKVNGKDAGKVMWKPYTVNISDFVVEGENEIEITLTTALRNLLGPHHSNIGEQYVVRPGTFYRYSPIWAWGKNPEWADGYSFVHMGPYI